MANIVLEEVDALIALYGDNVSWIVSPYSNDDLPCSSTGFSETAVLKVIVPIRIENDSSTPLHVQIYTPIDNMQSLPIGEDDRPMFERSISGRRWFADLEISTLPPLDFRVIITHSTVTSYSLSSYWLNESQLSSICMELDKLQSEMEDMPILCCLVDWLENQTVHFLALSNPVIIIHDETTKSDDNRAICLGNNIQDKVMQILKYDIEYEKSLFCKSNQDCDVCCMQFLGSEMLRLQHCMHYFCRQCLTHFVTSTLEQGTINSLKCLQPNCDGVLNANEIREVAPTELYKRWEDLSAQKAIEAMQDVFWCPRCLLPAVLDSLQDTVAVCGHCHFAFCIQCKDVFHPPFYGTSCETFDLKLEKLEKEQTNNDAYLESKERRRKLQLLKLEALSRVFVKKTSKPCPSCGISVQKVDGCNKMTCFLCLQHFCWVCGCAIKGYNHFQTSGGCNLSDIVPQAQVQNFYVQQKEPPLERIQMDQELEMNPKLMTELRKCPQCKQNNLRKDMNNHLRCWACHAHFCCSCNLKILEKPISAHFSKALSKCDQHSE